MFKAITDKTKNWLRRMAVKRLFTIDQSRGWIPVFQESYIGAFQIDDPVSLGDALEKYPINFNGFIVLTGCATLCFV